MKYIIEIECDNDAFYCEQDDHAPGGEVMRILTYLLSSMGEHDLPVGKIRDRNGNTVGESRIEADAPEAAPEPVAIHGPEEWSRYRMS